MGGVTPVVEPFHRGWSRLVTDNDVVAGRPSLVTWVAKDRPYYSGKHKRHGEPAVHRLAHRGHAVTRQLLRTVSTLLSTILVRFAIVLDDGSACEEAGHLVVRVTDLLEEFPGVFTDPGQMAP